MKQKMCLIIILSILLGYLTLITGDCETESLDKLELWVLTEKSNSDGMNLQAEIIAERMEEANPGLTVILEILPTDRDIREARLTQLRTQIMSGNGPDVYLFPTGSELISDEPDLDTNIPIDPLFPDVEQAMELGIFQDVSSYYESDSELNIEALNQTVMDAGLHNGERLVLPMRYNIPVLYTRPDLCADYSFFPELFQSDFLTVAETVLSHKEANTAAVGLVFPKEMETIGLAVDYSRNEIQLTEEQIASYLRMHQTQRFVAAETTREVYDAADYHRIELFYSDGHQECSIENFIAEFGDYAWPKVGQFHHECFNLLAEYCSKLYHWTTYDMPLYVGYLSDVLETIGVTRITGQQVEIYPIRANDGSIQASIAYWGAVGSSCSTPELAYDFLRQFLNEEFQWDIYRPRVNNDVPYWLLETDPQFDRMVEDSLPVRTEGCVEYLWDNLQYQVEMSYTTWVRETRTNVGTIQSSFVTSEDVPALNWKIDHVYFPVSLPEEESLEYAMRLLNSEDGTPMDVDIDELAAKIHQNLWWHMAEG